jgi:hypothetical protein
MKEFEFAEAMKSVWSGVIKSTIHKTGTVSDREILMICRGIATSDIDFWFFTRAVQLIKPCSIAYLYSAVLPLRPVFSRILAR